jgi:hypothetical protein
MENCFFIVTPYTECKNRAHKKWWKEAAKRKGKQRSGQQKARKHRRGEKSGIYA